MSGFQTYRPDGSLQFDADLMTYCLHSKGTLNTGTRFGSNTAPSSVKIPVPSSGDPLVAVRSQSGLAFSGTAMDGNQRYYVYQCANTPGEPVSYWVFAKATEFPRSNIGLELFNGAGQMTFSSNQQLMIVADVVDQSFAGVAGRSYAIIMANLAGHSEEMDRFVYRDGQPYLDRGGLDEGGGANHTWGRQMDAKLYGFRWPNAHSADYAEVSYDDVVTMTNVGPSPDPAQSFWSVPLLACMVVDVTGI